jgi:hypothetical protein
MTLSAKTTGLQNKLRMAILAQNAENPMQVFNKMCFGFVSNNWVVVISSILKLTTFAIIIAFPRSV